MTPSLEQLESSFERGQLSLSDLLSLRRELGAPFKFHPLGFIACTLLTEGTRKLRLHYWPLAGAAQQSPECQIHDHLFEFKSWVLAGAVENVEYIAAPDGVEFSVYRTEYAGDRSILSKTGATLRLAEQTRHEYTAGLSYSVQAGVLHETVRGGTDAAFTALLTNDVSAAAPTVLGPLAGLDRYVYDRGALSESIVEEMLARTQRFA